MRKRTLIAAASVLMLALAGSPGPVPDEARAARGLRWVLDVHGARKSDARYGRVPELARLISEDGQTNGLDVDALVTLMWTESSMRPDAVGKHGELGYYQLHGDLKRGADTVEENVRRGAARLALAVEKCSPAPPVDWEQAYGHYRSGECERRFGLQKALLLQSMKRALDEEER